MINVPVETAASNHALTWEGIVAILAIVVSLLSILLNFYMNKKTSFINTVTAERVKWLNKLRDNISSFCGLTHHWVMSNIDDQKKQEILQELDKLRYLIKLQLNPFNPKEKELYNKIAKKIDEIPDLTDKEDKFKNAFNELISESQVVLKNEWEKVKDEAEKGRVK